MVAIARFSSLEHGSLHFGEDLKSTFTKRQRVVVQLSSAEPIHCMLHQDESGLVVGLNKALCKKLGLREGEEVEVEIAPDTSRFQAPEPEEFFEVLYQDPEAEASFLKLTHGQQRAILFFIYRFKSVQTRINRSLSIATRLKAGFTKPQDLIK